MGIVECVTCIVGSVVIVTHVPQEHTLSSIQEIWTLATQPVFFKLSSGQLVLSLKLIRHALENALGYQSSIYNSTDNTNETAIPKDGKPDESHHHNSFSICSEKFYANSEGK
ncbi:hypothetical protein ABKV19_022514 [Rosa sericea]